MNKEAFPAACLQVYKPKPSVQRILREHAAKIVEDAAKLGLRPHGGGELKDHYAGKIAEACFWDFLDRNDVQNAPQCFGLFDERNPVSDHIDFLVWMGRDFQSVDVKSGMVEMPFEKIPIESYGLTVPEMQARRGAVLIYAHVFVNFSDARAPEAVFAGWCYRWEVLEKPVHRGVGNKPNFYKVPVVDLRSPRELVKLSMLPVATESLERLSLARS